jgi:5-methylcytosine-specific restriction endonuclease McrA
MSIDQSVIDRLYREQHGICQFCWRPIPPYSVHHAVYTRDIHFAKWLDMAENLVLACPVCHADHGKLSNLFMRCCVWSDKIDRGYDMEKWHDSIPMFLKDNFVYIGKEERNENISSL